MSVSANPIDDAGTAVEELFRQLHKRLNFEFASHEEECAFRQTNRIGEWRWKGLRNAARRKQRRNQHSQDNESLKRIERANVEPLIQGFLDTRFKGATKGERDFILEQIHKEVKAPDGVYDFCLFDMVQGGLRGVRKRYRRRYLRYFYQHVWAAIKGVLKILIALMIFANLQGSFQTIVVSLLITLYVYVRRSSASIWLFTASGNQAGYLRFLALREAAGLGPTSEEWAASFTLQEENRKAIIRHYVNDVCHSILIVIVGWNLFKAL